MRTISQTRNTKRGSTLLMILVLVTAVSLIVGTAMKLTSSENKINKRHILRQHAVIASESLSEYAIADIMDKFDRLSSIALVNSELSTSSSTVNFPTKARTFYAGTNLKMPPVTATNSSGYSEIIVGQIPAAAERTYINPDSQDDPLKGKLVDVRQVEILSKAVIEDKTKTLSTSKDVTIYTREVLEIRDAPLLSHGVFYNMDLEFHPGPTMEFNGSVHSNTDTYLSAGGQITFKDTVTSAGKIYHGLKKKGNHGQHGKVYIQDDSGTNQDMYNGSGDKNSNSSWLDARDADWKEKADLRWDKQVQDESHGIPTYNPVGIKNYVPVDNSIAEGADRTADDPAEGTKNVIENYAYALIEPVLTENNTNYTGTAAEDINRFKAIRTEKFAYKAGLIFKVSGTGRTATDHADESTYDYTSGQGDYKVTAWKYVTDTSGNPIIDSTTGLPQITQVKLPSGVIGAANSNLDGIDTDGKLELYATSDGGSTTNGDVTSGLYDHREDKGLDTLSIDMNRLRELVDNTDGNYIAYSDAANPWKTNSGPHSGGETVYDPHSTGTTVLSAPTAEFNPETDWNGVVYVEFPTVQHPASTTDDPTSETADPHRIDRIVEGSDRYVALQIIDGKYDSATDDGGAPRPTHDDDTPVGLTIATNAPLYTVGHINADGVAHTNDNRALDRTDEPPMLLVSDSLTVLSAEWAADHRIHSNENATGSRKAATQTEFAAAAITGLKPTIPTSSVNAPSSGAQSGGLHNFPRFLEDWDKPLTIRGSLISLWESEVHENAMPDNYSHFYSPPTRDWGYNDNFRNGIYPPGATNVRDYTRISYGEITESEYNTRKSAL